MKNEEKFDYLIKRISKEKYVQAIFLFGSRTNQRIRTDSDYDLAILTNTTREKELDLINLGDDTFDISIFWKLPLVIQFRILTQGKMIFCRNPKAILEAKRKVIKSYLDFAPLLIKSYNRDINELQQNTNLIKP